MREPSLLCTTTNSLETVLSETAVFCVSVFVVIFASQGILIGHTAVVVAAHGQLHSCMPEVLTNKKRAI